MGEQNPLTPKVIMATVEGRFIQRRATFLVLNYFCLLLLFKILLEQHVISLGIVLSDLMSVFSVFLRIFVWLLTVKNSKIFLLNTLVNDAMCFQGELYIF